MRCFEMPLRRAIRISAMTLAVLALPVGLVQAKGGHGGGHGGGGGSHSGGGGHFAGGGGHFAGGGGHMGGGGNSGAAVYHGGAVRTGAPSRAMTARTGTAINRLGSTQSARSNPNSLGPNRTVNSRTNLDNNQASSRARTLNNVGGTTNRITGNQPLSSGGVGSSGSGAVGSGRSGSPPIRTFGTSFFGSNLYGSGAGNSGYGSGGYGFGNGGYGNGGGYGYGNGGNARYVMVYIPGFGWVLAPIQALRGF